MGSHNSHTRIPSATGDSECFKKDLCASRACSFDRGRFFRVVSMNWTTSWQVQCCGVNEEIRDCAKKKAAGGERNSINIINA